MATKERATGLGLNYQLTNLRLSTRGVQNWCGYLLGRKSEGCIPCLLNSTLYPTSCHLIKITFTPRPCFFTQTRRGHWKPFATEVIMGMRVGYARCSILGQKLDVQWDKISDCDRIFHEKASAGSKKIRLQFNILASIGEFMRGLIRSSVYRLHKEHCNDLC